MIEIAGLERPQGVVLAKGGVPEAIGGRELRALLSGGDIAGTGLINEGGLLIGELDSLAIAFGELDFGFEKGLPFPSEDVPGLAVVGLPLIGRARDERVVAPEEFAEFFDAVGVDEPAHEGAAGGVIELDPSAKEAGVAHGDPDLLGQLQFLSTPGPLMKREIRTGIPGDRLGCALGDAGEHVDVGGRRSELPSHDVGELVSKGRDIGAGGEHVGRVDPGLREDASPGASEAFFIRRGWIEPHLDDDRLRELECLCDGGVVELAEQREILDLRRDR